VDLAVAYWRGVGAMVDVEVVVAEVVVVAVVVREGT